MGELLQRINEVLTHTFQISPQNVKTYFQNSPWNKTAFKIVFDRYLSETDGQPELGEKTLELLKLVLNFFDGCLNDLVITSFEWVSNLVELENYVYKRSHGGIANSFYSALRFT